VVYAYVSGIGLPVTALWFPLLVVPLILFTTGITLLGSAMNVFARDIRLALPLVTQLWLLITPVMYPLSTVPDSLRNLYLLNPMTGLVESFRAILLYGNAPSYELLAPAVVGSLVVMLVGGWYFGATEARFADVI
jgi:lipopolysaccharide transport system permease protein